MTGPRVLCYAGDNSNGSWLCRLWRLLRRSGPKLRFRPLGLMIAVTSAGQTQAGQTTVVANVGLALAKLGHKVLLVDANGGCSRPLLQLLTPFSSSPPHVWHAAVDLTAMRRSFLKVTENMSIYSALDQPLELDTSAQQLARQIRTLAQDVDYLLVDCPVPSSRLHNELVRKANKCVFVCTKDQELNNDALGLGYLERKGGGSPYVVLNRARLSTAPWRLGKALETITQKENLDLLGIVPEDNQLLTAFDRGQLGAVRPGLECWEEFMAIAAALVGSKQTTALQRLIDRNGQFVWRELNDIKFAGTVEPDTKLKEPPKSDAEPELSDYLHRLLTSPDAVHSEDGTESAVLAQTALQLTLKSSGLSEVQAAQLVREYREGLTLRLAAGKAQAAAISGPTAVQASEEAPPAEPAAEETVSEPDLISANSEPSIPMVSLPTMLKAFHDSPYIYSAKVVEELHSALHALQQKHFVILNGLSGTGKSKFAQAYANARYGFSLTSVANPYFRMIAVPSTWRDRSPLLGYHDRLSGKYVVPEFLELLLKAHVDPEHDYVVCLDEMNLSVVEHYMSDLLSAWESGEPIRLHGATAELLEVPEYVTIPANLLVIGTMNLDETVQEFSPRVIDRAYSIHFGKVNIATLSEKILKWPEAKGHEALLRRTLSLLERVRAEVEPYGFTVSYRTVVESCSHLLHLIRESATLTPDEILDCLLVRKVLPRLRGDDRLVPLLQNLVSLVEESLVSSLDSGGESLVYLRHQLHNIEVKGHTQYGS